MIGKNNSINSKFLFFFISAIIFSASYFFKDYKVFLYYVLSLIASLVTSRKGLQLIKKYNLLQKIKEEGPREHKQKENTPTMGGIFFIPIFLIIILICDIGIPLLKGTLLITIFTFFLIGLIDDYLSIKKKTNLGLMSQEKIIMQTLTAIIFTIFLHYLGLLNNSILLNGNQIINVKHFIIPISVITIVGLSNAINLTDGLDGLAIGCSAISFCSLGVEILFKNNSDYIIFSLLCFALSGLCMGFLKFNQYPARVFMGDTGSLCLGAILGIFCVITNSFFTTFFISTIFIIETMSVITQVSIFKITKYFYKKGKRVFLMAPIHHHYELKGIKEQNIVGNFWLINIIASILGIVLKNSF